MHRGIATQLHQQKQDQRSLFVWLNTPKTKVTVNFIVNDSRTIIYQLENMCSISIVYWDSPPPVANSGLAWDCQQNYFTSSDPHHDMLGGGCQVRVVIENMMGRMENLRTLISGFLGLVILVRWALVTMFLSWTTQTGCRIHRTYVSLIGSGEGRHTTHLLKCVPLLSTSQTDWKQSSDVLSDISFDILSDISSDKFFWHIFWHSFWHIFWHSFWHLSDISFDILSDKSFDTLSDISSDISFHMLSDISSDILSDISKPKPNIHSFTQKAALQTLYLPHTTQQK